MISTPVGGARGGGATPGLLECTRLPHGVMIPV